MTLFAHRASRGKRCVAASIVLAAVAATASFVTFSPAAQAAVPAFPDNITIFPDRDFISVDGFAGHAGEQITLEVRAASSPRTQRSLPSR